MGPSERRFLTQIRTAAAMLVGLAVTWLASPASAQDSLAELLKKCPPLSSSDESLRTLELEGILPLTKARFEFAWSRDDGYCLTLADRKSRVPVFFAANEKRFLFDVVHGTVEVDPKYPLDFKLTSKSALYYHRSFDPGIEFEIDLASFFVERKDERAGEKRDGGGLRFQFTTTLRDVRKPLEGKAVVDFAPAESYPLRRLELHGTEVKELELVIDVLRVNQPLRRKLKTFPKDADFPAGLEFVPHGPRGLDDYSRLFEVEINLFHAAGVDDPAQRPKPDPMFKDLLKEIDWDAAKANRDKFGPPLIKVFAREAP